MVSHRYVYVHDFLMHPNDENVFHMYGIHNVVHFDELNDVGSKRIQLKMFLYNRHICMVVHRYDIYVYDHLNLDEL